MSKLNSNSRRLQNGLITGLVVLLVASAIILIQLVSSDSPPTGGQRMTLQPQIMTNLTQLPQATPLSGEAADQVSRLKAMVDACPDYTPERRSQMEQHIEWLLHPASIPPDIIIALGVNPTGRLVYGMASYTSIQWRLNDRAPDSCLIPIGALLDEMLSAAGEPPFPIADESP